MKLSTQEMELLNKCDGVHASIQEIFKCASCTLLLKELA